MKRIPGLVVLLMLTATPLHAATPCPDPGCSEPVSKAISNAAKAKEEVFTSMTATTIVEDKSQLEECLGGIQKIGIGADFNIPSLDDLFNAACDALQSIVNERINAVKGKFTYSDMSGMINAGATSGESNVKVNVKDISKNVVQKLKDPIQNAIK